MCNIAAEKYYLYYASQAFCATFPVPRPDGSKCPPDIEINNCIVLLGSIPATLGTFEPLIPVSP